MIYLIFITVLVSNMIISDYKPEYKEKLFFVNISVILAISIFRYNMGYDYQRYVLRISEMPLYGPSIKREFFSYSLLMLAHHTTPSIFFALNSLFTIIPISIFLKIESKDYNFSLIIFAFFPMFMLNSWSVVRNFTAVAIVFYSQKYIFKNNLKSFMICIFTATMFHLSSIVALPLFYIYNKELRYKVILKIGVFIYILILLLGKFKHLLPKKIEIYLSGEKVSSGGKTLIFLYLIVLFSYLAKYLLLEYKNIRLSSKNNYYLKVVTIGIIFYVITAKYGTISYRLSMFYYINIMILIPNLIKELTYAFGTTINKYSIFLKYALLLSFLVSFFYMLYVGGDSYYPYQSLLYGGVQ